MTEDASKGSLTAREFIDTGLDLGSDTFSDDERDRMLAWYREHHDYGDLDLAAFSRFQLLHDPGGFKRQRRYIFTLDDERDGVNLPVGVAVLLYTYSYAVLGNGKGAFYEAIATRSLGATKAQVLETFRLAALAGGPLALNPLGELMMGYLDEWVDPPGASGLEFPAGWDGPPALLRSGINLGTDDLGPGERDAILGWYERMEGGVPFHVRRMADDHPRALKTLRVRFEGALGGALPAQVIPLMGAHVATIRQQPREVRRAAHTARALGVHRHQFMSALLWAGVYGGDAALEPAFEACEGVF